MWLGTNCAGFGQAKLGRHEDETTRACIRTRLHATMFSPDDLSITTLGPCTYESPLVVKGRHFVDEAVRVRVKRHIGDAPDETGELSFEEAGPRRKLFFDPAETTAAFVTCGGLSPGLNNVIRSGFLELTHNYGVQRVLGIRNGYAGLNPDSGLEPTFMTQRFGAEHPSPRWHGPRKLSGCCRSPRFSSTFSKRRRSTSCSASVGTARSEGRTPFSRRSRGVACRSRSSASRRPSTMTFRM